MPSKPAQDTARGEQSSGRTHTKDYDDRYAAGEAREQAKRADDVNYHDSQPRAGGREREKPNHD